MSVIRALPVTLANYGSHPLHSVDRTWTEKNCSIDVWIEVLHALGLDPIPACSCVFSSGVNGRQWTFLKFFPEHLSALYGLAVEEIYIWRHLVDHVMERLEVGQLLTMEADSWYLPDTAGTVYRNEHVKTTIVPNLVDNAEKRLEYFHGSGYWELCGQDFDGVMRTDCSEFAGCLPPYVEAVDLSDVNWPRDLLARTTRITRSILLRRPAGNPIRHLGERIAADVPWLATQSAEVFHNYAFGLIRQCGAAAEMASALTGWLADRGLQGLDGTADAFGEVAVGARSLQLQLARVTQGRSVTIDETVAAMAHEWEKGIDAVVSCVAG